MLTGVKSRGKSVRIQEPVSTMTGQAVSRAAIDTQWHFRQRIARKPKRGCADRYPFKR